MQRNGLQIRGLRCANVCNANEHNADEPGANKHNDIAALEQIDKNPEFRRVIPRERNLQAVAHNEFGILIA